MKPTLRLCLLLLLLVTNNSVLSAPVLITTAVTEDEKQKVDAFLNGRSPLKIESYLSPQLNSLSQLEHILFRKAVLLGGLDAVFEDFIVPNSARARLSMLNARTLSAGGAHWNSYFQTMHDKVLESDVVIPSGLYEKGLYTTKENQRRFVIESLQDLQKLSAVSSYSWGNDWATLSSLKLSALHSSATRPLHFKMIARGRADFTLQDFSSLPDLSIEEQGIRLYPIQGVKIALRGTRHFYLNKDHPDSRVVFDSLQKGLRIMKQRGEINRSLVESGFINKTVKNWVLLNPE